MRLARRHQPAPLRVSEINTALPALPLRLQCDWRYEVVGPRQHYLAEGFLGDALAARAYGWFEPDARFVLEKIETDEAQRSRGYGSVLLEALRDQARSSRCREFVICGVRSSNTRAIAWYESLGATPGETANDLLEFIIAPP